MYCKRGRERERKAKKLIRISTVKESSVVKTFDLTMAKKYHTTFSTFFNFLIPREKWDEHLFLIVANRCSLLCLENYFCQCKGRSFPPHPVWLNERKTWLKCTQYLSEFTFPSKKPCNMTDNKQTNRDLFIAYEPPFRR